MTERSYTPTAEMAVLLMTQQFDQLIDLIGTARGGAALGTVAIIGQMAPCELEKGQAQADQEKL